MDVTGSISAGEDFDYYQSRLRVLLILHFFSKPYHDELKPSRKSIFETEVKIQKIDFLLRYPDYLAYEILSLVNEGELQKSSEIKDVVSHIFKAKEPVIRKQEMERFFFGAYEDLADIIAFLQAFGFVEYESEKSASGKNIGKKYFVTEFGEERIKRGILEVSAVSWYAERCQLIREYFGELSGSDLKVRQYQIRKYKDTPLNQHIDSIEEETKEMYLNIYKEALV